jgi:two-component system sensor histidine kinase/response regulator
MATSYNSAVVAVSIKQRFNPSGVASGMHAGIWTELDARRTAGTEKGSSRAATILVADDDPTSRLLVAASLEGHSGKLVHAENGSVALQALENDSFDLAIVDLHMPVLDGYGFIEGARMRADTRHLPIIVVTSRNDVVAIERAFALGATSFLSKPIDWNIFRHQVDFVLKVGREERDTRRAKERAERLAAFRGRALASLDKAIGGALAGLPEQDPSIAAACERIRAALARVHRASDIVSGAARCEPECVKAGDLVQAATAVALSALGENAAARLELGPAGDVDVFCDRRLASEALGEILRNALLHSPSEQKVRLDVVDVPPDRIRFEIVDGGPGIPEHIADLGPDGFGALSSLGGVPAWAQGLGLPMASAILARHGGHLGIMSEPGRGSEVFLTFPRCGGRR